MKQKSEILQLLKGQIKNMNGSVTINIPAILDDWYDNKESYNKTILECLEEIKKMRGIGCVSTNRCTYGHVVFIQQIKVMKKATREFSKLNCWLSKYANKQLREEDVRYESISGKRDSIEVEDVHYLCHNDNTCSMALSWLRSNRLTGDSVDVKIESNTYYGDRFNSYGEDMEREWYGDRQYFAHVLIKTKGGKLKAERYIRA